MPGRITVLSRNSHSWLQGECRQWDCGFCGTLGNRECCHAYVGNAQLNPVHLSPNDFINEQLNWVSTNRQWPNFKLCPRHLPLATDGDRTLARWTSGLIQYSSVPVPKLASSTSECLSRHFYSINPLSALPSVCVTACCVFPTEMAVQGCMIQKESICQWDNLGTLPYARGWMQAPTLLLSVVPMICLAAPLVLKCRPVIWIYAQPEVCVAVLAVLPCVFSF